MSKKPIIVFEGIEGSGKTHHIKKLSKYLDKKKISYIKIREPGGSLNSEKIRKLILNKKSTLNRNTDLLLYLAARSENVEKLITKNYNKKIILIDRFSDSTLAYQHYGMNIDKNLIQNINKYILNKINVNFTFLHTVSQKNLKYRLSRRKSLNKYDKFKFDFYNKVQKGFIKLSRLNKKKYLLVNSNNSISVNKDIIIQKIQKLLYK